MNEILLIVHDASKVKYAASMARELTEKLSGQHVKITLFADGSPASRMLVNEEGKISRITASGGEVVSCVHDIQDAELLSRISNVITECAIDLERREREGAEILHV